MKFSFSSITPLLICLLLFIVSCEEQNPEIIDHIFFDGSVKLEDSTYYQITSPNGGEVWSEQSTQTITWNKGGNVSYNVQLRYFNGYSWSYITSNTPNDGEHSWTIPDITSSSDSCLIWIGDGSSSISDTSDAYFTLTADSTYYQITSPNGNESWAELSTQTVTWVSSGDVASSNEYVRLFYSLDGGLSYTQIGSNYEVNDGIFSWTLPQIYITNPNCRIKIQQSSSPYIMDISDESFTIYASSGQSDLINVISANGGEEWHEQTTEQITWETNGDIGGNQVYIGYSTDGGISWNDVVDDGSGNNWEETNDPPYTYRWDETANSGSYSWTLPNFSDTLQSCIIGVWSASNTALYDMSDDYFTINCDTNYYRILGPNGGEILEMGRNALIQWESGGDVGDVSLYYSEFGGDSWYSIDDYETNDGSFIWSVPTLQSDNSNCLIKIEDRDNPEWFDISDAAFTIAENPPPCDECGSEDFETGNFNNIPWWFDGDEPWTISTESYEGNYCARSGQIGSFETSELVINLNVENSGLISFYFKVSSESNWDKLKFYIDETFISEWSGEIDWEEFSFSVSQGNHEFRWIYYKDSGGDHGSDCVWIDNISFP